MIRRATPDDAPAISDLFARARDGMTYLPRIPDEVRPLLGGRFMTRAELWVAEEEGRIVGFAGISGNEVTHLYTDPPSQNRGIGTALLEHVKRLRPGRLELWCSRGTRLLAGSTGGTASTSSGSPTARKTWSRSRTRSTSGVRPARANAQRIGPRSRVDRTNWAEHAHRSPRQPLWREDGGTSNAVHSRSRTLRWL